MSGMIGKALPRIDGRAKVTGGAHYAADFNQPGQAYAVIVPATVGRGRVIGIDTARARQMPGVIEILSHLNAPTLAYRPHKALIDPGEGERLHVLQDDQIRFHGQPVAVVVADTLDEAEHAAAALAISYAAEQAAVDIAGSAGEAPGPASGVQADTARGDADAALAQADVSIDARYGIARENHNPMEPHATVAAWTGDRLTLWSKSQWVGNEQAEIAAIFDIPPEQVQVICPFIGGAFGTSLRTWPHVTLAALAARMVGKPVKLVLTRKQMFFFTGFRPHTSQRVALGAGRDGRLNALIHEAVAETSRYEQFTEALLSATRHMYACPNLRTRYRLTGLDVSTPTHMRGPGEASGVYALECAMDELAYELGLDPVELRRRNEPRIDEGENKPFSSRSLISCFDLGADRFGWAQRNPEPRSMRDGRLLIGMGTASATYPAFRAPANALARLLPDGSAEIEVAASDMGPGTYTSLTQVAAEALGVPMDRVHVKLGRSDYPATPPHGGSWTMASVGSAVQAACLAVREKAGDGRVERPVEAQVSSQRDAETAERYSSHTFGAIFVEVSVDPDVGTIRMRRAFGAYGAGRIINPRLAHSQCVGGMIGGIGMALMERTVLDARDGRPVNAHMADYLVPVNLDIAEVDAAFVEEEDLHVNPLGAKGLGEIALVGMAPAIANAVFHATGKRVRDLPIRLEDLL